MAKEISALKTTTGPPTSANRKHICQQMGFANCHVATPPAPSGTVTPSDGTTTLLVPLPIPGDNPACQRRMCLI